MKTNYSFLSLVSVAAGLLLAGCGKTDTTATSASTAPAPSDGVRTVEITANDAMQYSVKEIRANAGEKLRVVLSNVGKMPKQAMAHNWVLLKPMTDTEVNAFGMAAASKAPDYLPADRSSIIAHTKLVGGGESDRLEITVPAEAGEYPFICSFPGHYAIMKGKLIVN